MLALFILLNIEVGHSDEWYKPVHIRNRKNSSAVLLQDQEDDPNRTLWVETIRTVPRIFIIHNLLNRSECDHLIRVATRRGMKVIDA